MVSESFFLEEDSVDSNKIQYYEKVTNDVQLEFIQVQNHCSLCSSVLILEHDLSEDSSSILETASCPECQIRNRSRSFVVN